jgi:hypothetical protein
VESLSEPNALTPTAPAFEVGCGPHAGGREEREADDVAERRDGAQIAAVLVELDHRGQSDMHGIDAARLQRLGAAAAAIHADDFDIETLRRIEPSRLRHPQGQDSIHGFGNADLEMRRLCSGHGVCPSGEKERERGKPPTQSASMFMTMFHLHVGFLAMNRQLVDDRQPLYACGALSGFTVGTLADLKNPP